MHNKIINKLEEYKNIAILGYGREGKSTYKFIRTYLKEQTLTIIDKRNILDENPELLKDENLFTISGDKYLDNLDKYDLIIKTPGISLKDVELTNIKEKITSQIELLLEVNSKNMIGITGTKGKSTTSSLIHKIIKDQGLKTYLVGNIGVPVFDQINEYDDETIIVTEMSSHQLEFVNKSPHIGIVLNLFQDHLDHAGTLENYHKSKMNIIRYQNESDYAIYDKDNEYLKDKIKEIINTNILSVSTNERANIYLENQMIYLNNEFIIDSNKIERNILGEHNLKNIMFAILVSDILELDFNKVLDSIKEFMPLEHRMEYVGIYKDIKFYNDSIATIPEATINACITLKDVDTLIFGGQDRGIDYTKLIEYLRTSNIKNLICMPATGYKLSELIKNKDNNIYKIETLEEAVQKAYEVTEKGKICLLSPSAPSYEYFKNFEEKGKRYKEVIKEFGEKNENKQD